jgi:single-strand DNA-binding protein
MANFNKVFLMGNLTRDPELRYTPSGTPVCEFGIATNRTYTTSDGEKREETCFVDITMWGRRGEVVSEYFSKGRPIFVEGRLKYDTWDSPEGRRSKHTVVAENFEFVGGRGGGGGRSGGGGGGGRSSGGGGRSGGGGQQRSGGSGGGSQQSQPSQQQGGSSQNQPQQQNDDQEGFDVSDDEIPF